MSEPYVHPILSIGCSSYADPLLPGKGALRALVTGLGAQAACQNKREPKKETNNLESQWARITGYVQSIMGYFGV